MAAGVRAPNRKAMDPGSWEPSSGFGVPRANTDHESFWKEVKMIDKRVEVPPASRSDKGPGGSDKHRVEREGVSDTGHGAKGVSDDIDEQGERANVRQNTSMKRKR